MSLRSHPSITVPVRGFVLDLATGLLSEVSDHTSAAAAG
jgi:hypothetical protein